ncbi:glutamate receptor subunit protein GluR5 precursor [Biomphalaria pfeifferi]|uniref:Glutamate receptor subunit protein GluR5 n=1 Tax=Biomphalaria pfeifferi TaxID=112525 RepID=A0AAD8BTK6_BIOPF|nr:glutamate receptor subunit protein GluR5 precursor [Biomphalaria pfeifferi]
MDISLTRSTVFIVFSVILQSTTGWTHIPFGILLDGSLEPESKTAMMFALSLHNSKKQTEPKLQMLFDDYNTDNTFEFVKKVCKQMSTGIFLLYGSMSFRTFHVCQSYSHLFHLPYITNYFPGMNLTEVKGRLLFLKPDYVSALAELVMTLGWKQFTYMYDHLDGVQRAETIKPKLSDVKVVMMQLLQVYSAHEDLRLADMGKKDQETFILLDVSNWTAYSAIVKQIAEVGMNREGYNYILATLDIATLDLFQLQQGGANVIGFQSVDFDDDHVKEFQSQWKSLEPTLWPGAGSDRLTSEVAFSLDVVELIKRAISKLLLSRPDIFQYTFRRGNIYNTNFTVGIQCNHRPIQPWMHGNSLYDALRQVSFQGYSGHILFDIHGRRQNYSIDVLSLTSGSSLRKIGQWHSLSGLWLDREEKVKDQVRPDMRDNRTVIISTLQVPFLMLRTSPTIDGVPLVDNNRFEGYTKDLADAISQHLDFQYVLKIIENNEQGRDLGNNSWTGIIGILIDKTADMAIGPLSITLEREKVVDFSMSFMKSGISALLQQPAKVRPNMFSFMEPFSLALWLSILLVSIVVSLTLLVVCCLVANPNESSSNINPRLTLTDSFWFVVSSILSQGSDIVLRSPASRIVGGIWWFFTLILLLSYTANLAAFLTVERIRRPIKCVEDLLQQNEVSFGTRETGFPRDFLESTNIASYQQIWKTMADSYNKVMVKTDDEGLQRVQSSGGKYAFLLESSLAEYYNNRKPCSTIEIKSSFSHKGFGIATQLRSVLTKEINFAIMHLKEDGTLQRLKQVWWDEKNECFKKISSKDSNTHSLELTSVLGIFLILILGLCISMCVVIIETIFHKKDGKELNEKEVNNVLKYGKIVKFKQLFAK